MTGYSKHLNENLIIICRSNFHFRYRNGSSFEGISNAENDVHFGQDWALKSDVRVLDRRRLSEAWFERHLLEWKIDLELGETEIRPLTCAEVDPESESEMTKKKARTFLGNGLGIIITTACQKVWNVRQHTLYQNKIELQGNEKRF